MSPKLPLYQFLARWQATELSERSAAQSHFIDLCQLLDHPTPAEMDPRGESFAFEKGVSKSGGGQGFADVWYRGHFAWEYKGDHKNLDTAYLQLLKYKDSLDNPPLLVVSDSKHFQIHTNFTNTAKRVYRLDLPDLTDTEPKPGHPLPPLQLLHALFEDPEKLRPDYTTARVTEEAAAQFARLADSLRRYGAKPDASAHFLVRLLFCLFSQDIGLLPDHLFTQLVQHTRTRATDFSKQLRQLFETMATGGYFGFHRVPYFDGAPLHR